MNNNDYLLWLKEAHAVAKKKMVVGIVFAAIAFTLVYLGGFMVGEGYGEMYPWVLFSLPFWGIATPFLIVGIKGVIRCNSEISNARRIIKQNGVETVEAPTPTAPQGGAPVRTEPWIVTQEELQAEKAVSTNNDGE